MSQNILAGTFILMLIPTLYLFMEPIMLHMRDTYPSIDEWAMVFSNWICIGIAWIFTFFIRMVYRWLASTRGWPL